MRYGDFQLGDIIKFDEEELADRQIVLLTENRFEIIGVLDEGYYIDAHYDMRNGVIDRGAEEDIHWAGEWFLPYNERSDMEKML